jgi:insecticidal toxin complex protein TccC
MNLHSHTPNLVVTDSRGSIVRQIGFYRVDAESVAEPRVVRQVFDAVGRQVSSTDPRLQHPNTSTIFNLQGEALFSDNVDAGWRVSFSGEAGQVMETWDSRGNQSSVTYDTLLRPVAINEQLFGLQPRCVERFDYADASAGSAARNQCGQLVRRDDPAGSTSFPDYGLTGAGLLQGRRFLVGSDLPDWPEEMTGRDALLEPETYLSSSSVDAVGEVIASSDARGHRQVRGCTCDGQLKGVDLQLSEADLAQPLVSDIRYNAFGAVEQETAGNGVISSSHYDEANGRLIRLLSQFPEGKVQDLNYAYDPVGNVLSIEDAAQSTAHFSNQRTDPVNRYLYDSLYQLIEATGREVATLSHGPELPGFQPLPLDPGKLINYVQRFEYDAGGNLIARHHSGTETWRMATSTASNRSLPQLADGSLPGDQEIDTGFDAYGNLQALQPGQAMTWDLRNQLSEVTSVVREDAPNDGELYRYDGDGQRMRKVRYTQTRSRTLLAEVRYLPGLEIHRNNATAEARHVLTVETGRCTVRLLHWDSGKPEGIENDQLRYSISDHLGSNSLELDGQAKLISHEGYYPYGGTAWWAGRNALEAKYKTVRYSGKERDATGLYYYGFRYYAPWLQRWINADPAGDVQGLNRYGFVHNSPVKNREKDGQTYEGTNDVYEGLVAGYSGVITFRGLDAAPVGFQEEIYSALSSVISIYDVAIQSFERNPPQFSGLMRSFFGTSHETVMPAVVDAWKASLSLAKQYQSPEGRDKIVGVESSHSNLGGFVAQKDLLGRIFINEQRDSSIQLEAVLGHEITHLETVEYFSGAGPGAKDYFYLNNGSRGLLSGGDDSADITGEQGLSEVLMGGGLNEAILAFTPELVPIFINRVQAGAPSHSITDLPSAVHIFNMSRNLAAEMASNNADSLLASAAALHKMTGVLSRQTNALGLRRTQDTA